MAHCHCSVLWENPTANEFLYAACQGVFQERFNYTFRLTVARCGTQRRGTLQQRYVNQQKGLN